MFTDHCYVSGTDTYYNSPQTEVICSNENREKFPVILHVHFRVLYTSILH